VLAVIVAFLSASQDIVIDAYRVELLNQDEQGPGAGMIQTGYRIGMLIAGAGALIIAARATWFAAYATMAALIGIGMLVLLFAPEPAVPVKVAIAPRQAGDRWHAIRQWLATAVVGPLADFMRRPLWVVILIFILGYKLGEAMAGVMAMPLYVSLGFSLEQIAAVSKLFGFFATVIGALIGGVITAKLGVIRALVICGVLQSLGNLSYVLQAVGGHRLDYLALCVAVENLTGAMAGAALVAYLSDLCSPDFTATQYALLSSLAAVGRTLIASSGGILAEELGWVRFFLATTVVTLPALLLLAWIARRSPMITSGDSSLVASGGS
jgi:PAT family beta-lactamase induction signal transducer AmpG